MRALHALLVAALCLLVLGDASPSGAAGAPYRVIVNAGNPIGSMERRALSELFLKKTTRWSNGVSARPVDQHPSSSIRQRFSDEVMGRAVESVRSYWQQQVFSGRDVPPPELDGDEDVIRYVQKYPGAVGYVSAAADLHGVRVLEVR